MPNLDESDCHVWHFSVSESLTEIPNLTTLLSVDEKQRLDTYKYPKDKTRFVIARARLRQVLERYTNTPAASITFHYTQYKKPFVNDPIQFNISHTNTDIVIAIAKHDVGIDIETIKEQKQALNIAKRFFCPEEYATLSGLKPSQVANVFYHIWTQKEAIVKALGKGLFHDIKNIQVSTQIPPQIISFKDPQLDIKNWSLFRVPINQKKTLCVVAVKGSVKKPLIMAF